MAKTKLVADFTLTESVKRKWLTMLRSGKFKQDTGDLLNHRGYCCLGVLCRAMGIPAAKIKWHTFPQDIKDLELPRTMSWSVPYKGELLPLSHLNDKVCLTFNEIADIVELTVETH